MGLFSSSVDMKLAVINSEMITITLQRIQIVIKKKSDNQGKNKQVTLQRILIVIKKIL